MSANRTDHAHVLWMKLDGDIYSPEMSLSRATADTIERDIWNGTYPGVCHAIYSYGTFANGGSYCREVTQDIAERLGRMSFAGRRLPVASAGAFLDAMGVAYFGEGRDAAWGETAQPFELHAPSAPRSSGKRSAPSKRRPKVPTPAQLRAEPQFKLPIAGGRASDSAVPAEAGRERPPLSAAIERDEEAGVEMLSLKGSSSPAEEKAGWDRFRALIRSWEPDSSEPESAGDLASEMTEEKDRAKTARRAAKGRH